MADQTTKPKGTFAKLMSSSPIQEEQGLTSGKPETPKSGNPESRESGKPETLKAGNQGIRETRKPETPKSGNPESRESGKPETLKAGNQGIRETRKPETPKSGNRDALKAIKYSTQLHPDMIKRLKQYALINDVKDYEVVQEALTEYLTKKQP